jgi:hypothetical protein
MSTPTYDLPGNAPIRPPKTWFARNWTWFVPVLITALALLIGLFVLGVLELVTSIMQSSDAYKTALQRAEDSPQVAEKIGHPIKVGWFTSGNINVSGDSGDADLSIPISGPRGKAHIEVSARKQRGTWTFQTLEVDVDGDDTAIPLLTPDIGAPAGNGKDVL